MSRKAFWRQQIPLKNDSSRELFSRFKVEGDYATLTATAPSFARISEVES